MRPAALLLAALAAHCASRPPPPAQPLPSPDAHTVTDAAAPAPSPDASPDAPPDARGDEARLYREATEAAARDDFAAAARLFAAAYEAAPSLAMAFNAFRMYERSASVDEAARWYDRVRSHDPPAAMRADLDQRLAALRDFARRRRDDIARPPPGDDALVREAAEFFSRGVSLYRRGRYAAALQAFEAALRYAQESRREVAELYFNLAVTHERLGHRAEAAAAFREYLSRRPDTPDRAAVERRARALSQ